MYVAFHEALYFRKYPFNEWRSVRKYEMDLLPVQYCSSIYVQNVIRQEVHLVWYVEGNSTENFSLFIPTRFLPHGVLYTIYIRLPYCFLCSQTIIFTHKSQNKNRNVKENTSGGDIIETGT